jgi:hypothetical protein
MKKQTKESKNLPFEEILHATREWCKSAKEYNKLAGIDSCRICGMNPEVLEQLLDGYVSLIKEIIGDNQLSASIPLGMPESTRQAYLAKDELRNAQRHRATNLGFNIGDKQL